MTYPLMPAANELRYRKKSIVAPVVSSTATCTRSLRHGNRVSRLGSSSLFTNRTSKSAGARVRRELPARKRHRQVGARRAVRLEHKRATADAGRSRGGLRESLLRVLGQLPHQHVREQTPHVVVEVLRPTLVANQRPVLRAAREMVDPRQRAPPPPSRRRRLFRRGARRRARTLISFSPYRGRLRLQATPPPRRRGSGARAPRSLSAPNASPRCPTTSTFFSASDHAQLRGVGAVEDDGVDVRLERARRGRDVFPCVVRGHAGFLRLLHRARVSVSAARPRGAREVQGNGGGGRVMSGSADAARASSMTSSRAFPPSATFSTFSTFSPSPCASR